MTQLRVLICSLDRLSRAGLAAELDRQPGLTVVGQVSGGEDSILPLDIYGPDVIVWDVSWETASSSRNLGHLPDGPTSANIGGDRATSRPSPVGRGSSFLESQRNFRNPGRCLTALSHGLQATDHSLARVHDESVSENEALTP